MAGLEDSRSMFSLLATSLCRQGMPGQNKHIPMYVLPAFTSSRSVHPSTVLRACPVLDTGANGSDVLSACPTSMQGFYITRDST